MRPQSLEARRDPGRGQHLPRHRCIAVAQRVQDAELQPVDPGLVGQDVIGRFLPDRRLRHAEPPESTRHRVVCMHGAGARRVVSRPVWPAGMHRHPVRHSRPPAGIGPGVEAPVKHQPRHAPLRIAADPPRHPRRMPLGGRGHAFGPRIDHPRRTPGFQHRQTQQRLQADVQFRAEPAPHRRGDDPHPVLRQRQNRGGIVAVHHRGLGAGADHQHIALHPGRPGLGFDIGVFDKAGLHRMVDDMGRTRQRSNSIPAPHDPLDQPVPGAVPMYQHRPLGLSQRRIGQRRKGRPHDRKSGKVGERPMILERHQRHRLAAEPGGPKGQDRLVGKGRDHPEPVQPRNIRCRPDSHRAARPRHPGPQIADHKRRMRMGRAHGAQHHPPRHPGVGPEHIPRDLCRTVQPLDPCADDPGFILAQTLTFNTRRHDCGQDLAIPRTAAQNPAQRLRHRCLIRRPLPQQRCRGHQHPRRADAALRRSFRQKRRAQPVQHGINGLHRLDPTPRHPRHWCETSTDRHAIDQNRAGPAIPGVTAHLGAAQTRSFAQCLG